ncbi:hypothetical protein B9Z55_005411 [Caenorhabditis nigoni]|nr:hypothetical protein B9Z55_005411 [Caenorhabditis nigoni]
MHPLNCHLGKNHRNHLESISFLNAKPTTKTQYQKRQMVIPMIRLLLTALFVLCSVIAQGMCDYCITSEPRIRLLDHLRKISGDAAPEKAQEPLDDFDDFIPTIDSSVRLDSNIPEPPPLPIGLQYVRKTEPALPPSANVAPPSIRPPEPPTTTPVPITTTSRLNQTISIPYDDEFPTTVDVDEELPEPTDDLEEFQKADLLEKEERNSGKDLVKKTMINKTNDYYITSPATTVMSDLQEDTAGEDSFFDFDKLFDKKVSVTDTREDSVEQNTKNTTTTATTTTSTTTTTSSPSVMTTHAAHQKTCIHVKELKTVDDSVRAQAGAKKGTIEVSVELGEEDDAETNDDSSEEAEEERRVRQIRENKKPVVWKKFEMNCDEEVDDKGKICKLWAAGGLCGTHKPTMFLFCRRTCLCVGPN